MDNGSVEMVEASLQRLEIAGNCWDSLVTTALSQYPVMVLIAENLGQEDLKRLRMVNSKWNFVASEELAKKSKIILKNQTQLLHYDRVFSSPFSTGELEGRSFSFVGGKWPLSILGEFLEGKRENVREIEVKKIHFRDEFGLKVLDSSTFEKFNICALTKLHFSSVKIKIPLNFFVTVKNIELIRCNVIANTEKISPEKLRLENVVFYEGEEFLAEIQIDNIVNLKKTKSMTITRPLEGENAEFRVTKIGANLSECRKLESLTLTAVNVKDWICSRSTFEKFNICALTKLHCSSVEIKIPLNFFVTVKDIELIKCNVIANKERISPEKLRLENIVFYEGEEFLPEIQIDNIFNLKKTKSMTITCPLKGENAESRVTKICINLSESRKLEYLKLTAVNVKDWICSRFTVDTVFLDQVNLYLRGFRVRVRNFSFNGDIIELAVIQADIEKLEIGMYYYDTHIVSYEQVDFPELKVLRLYGYAVEETYLFQTCTKLQNIYLGWDWPSSIEFDVNSIPTSVKVVTLYNIKFFEQGELTVDTLILDRYAMRDVEAVIQRIIPKTLVLLWANDASICQWKFQEFFLFLKKFNDKIKICVGPILFLNRNDYNLSKFSECSGFSDQTAKYFVFVNHKGECVSEKEFSVLKQ